MPLLITLENLSTAIMENGIKTIELQYLDPTGGVHCLMLSATKMIEKHGEYQLRPLMAHEIAGTLDGSSIPGFQNIDRTGLEIVPGSNPRIYIDPTDKTRVVIMGNAKEPNGPVYPKDPRNQAILAEKWLIDQQDLNLQAMRVGPEFEFFVFPTGVNPLALEADNSAYHCSAANNPSQQFMVEYLFALQEAGINAGFFHSEVASFQQEVGVNCETLLRAADNVIIQRELLKKLAKKHNVTISWEPKLLDAYHNPLKQRGKDEAINGSGLHTNLSFDTKDEKNAFVTYDEHGEPKTNELSDIASLCIAGLLKHANALQAFYNPSTISGARLGMGESPKFIVAGRDNRSALIRIVTILVGEESKTRIELRASDSMICPHTWFVAAQMAMVDAIQQGKSMSAEERAQNGFIPKIIDTNFYQMPEETRVQLQISELHTGKEILSQSVNSLREDHQFLLSPNGPFGNTFEPVLGNYTDTILKADKEREMYRRVIASSWLQAQSETPAAIEITRNQLLSEANALKRLELELLMDKKPSSGLLSQTDTRNPFRFYQNTSVSHTEAAVSAVSCASSSNSQRE